MNDAQPTVNSGHLNQPVNVSEHLQPGFLDREPVGRAMLMRRGSLTESDTPLNPSVAKYLRLSETHSELLAAERVAMSRPKSLRDYDQISMHAGDLLKQAKLTQLFLKDKRVAFVGDNDGASLLLGLLGTLGGDMPAHMTLLDFDRRILASSAALAQECGFASRLETRPYNVFDPVPDDLAGSFDVFYTNPPYGKKNAGASGRLFITRGIELCHRRGGAGGCVILPDDDERAWTAQAMHLTQRFLLEQGWIVREKISQLHHYNLPKDPSLTSSTVQVCDVSAGEGIPVMPYEGRRVPSDDITYFYGRKVIPPYPRYIREDGQPEYD